MLAVKSVLPVVARELNIRGMTEVEVFLAVADRLREFRGVNMLCDIGNGTMNVIYTARRSGFHHGVPEE